MKKAILLSLLIAAGMLLCTPEQLSAQEQERDSVMTRADSMLLDGTKNWNPQQIKAAFAAGADPLRLEYKDSDALLLHPAKEGDYDIFMLFIEHGVTRHDPYLLMELAVRGNNDKIVSYILEKEGNRAVGFYSTEKRIKLFLNNAIENRNLVLIETLLTYAKRGTPGYERYYYCNAVLETAVKKGNLEIVQYLIENGAEIKGAYQSGELLESAIEQCNEPIAGLLLQHGAMAQKSLSFAVEKDCLPIVRLFFESGGAKLNIQTERGNENWGNWLIEKATKNGNFEMVKYLTEVEAREQPDTDWDTLYQLALQEAASRGNDTIVRFLAQRITRKERFSGVVSSATYSGSVPTIEFLVEQGAKVNPNQELGHAVEVKKWQAVAFWLDHGASVDTEYYWGVRRRLVWISAVRGDVESVRVFLDHGASLGPYSANKQTLAMAAAQSGSVPMLELLVSRGADLKAVDNDGHNVLYYAATTNNINPEVVAWLLRKGVDSNLVDRYGRTPLIINSIYEYNEMDGEYGMDESGTSMLAKAKMLVEAGADVNARDINGMTPLMYAVQSMTSRLAEFYIESGADLQAKNNFGDTPAVFFSNYDVGETLERPEKMRELLGLKENEEPASPQIPRQEDVQSELTDAIRNGDFDAMKRAFARGADPNLILDFDSPSFPMRSAMQFGSSMAVLRFLVENGGLADTGNDNGTTPLMRAAMGGDCDAAAFFMDHGADPNQQNTYGNTALIFAARNGNLDMIRLLVARGADVNLQGNGDTPLEAASSYAAEHSPDQAKTAALLISLGAKEREPR